VKRDALPRQTRVRRDAESSKRGRFSQDIYHGGEGTASSKACHAATAQANLEHGTFNVVNVYDNCPPFKQQEIEQFYARTGLNPVSLSVCRNAFSFLGFGSYFVPRLAW
jgi:hypothetical protein